MGTSSWWLVWTQMSLSPPQISCWSSSGGVGDGGKSRNAPVQFIAQNGSPNSAWATQGSLGSPYFGSWTTLGHELKHWLGWLLASAQLNGFRLKAMPVATLCATRLVSTNKLGIIVFNCTCRLRAMAVVSGPRGILETMWVFFKAREGHIQIR